MAELTSFADICEPINEAQKDNAEIESLKLQIDKLQWALRASVEDLQEVEKERDRLKVELIEAEDKIDALNEEIDALNEEIEILQADIGD